MKSNDTVMEELRALFVSRGMEHTDSDLISIKKTISYFARKVMPRNWDWEKRQEWADESLQIGYVAVLEGLDAFDPGKNVPVVFWVVEYIRLRIFETFASHVINEQVEIEILPEHRKGVLSLMGLVVMDRVKNLDTVPLMLTGEKIRELNAYLKEQGYECKFATKKNQRPSEICVRIFNGTVFLNGNRKRYADYACIDELAEKNTLPEELISPEENVFIDGESKNEIEWKRLSQKMDVISDENILRAYAAMSFEERTVLRNRHGIFGAKELCRRECAENRQRTPQRIHQIERKAMVSLRENYLQTKNSVEEAMA